MCYVFYLDVSKTRWDSTRESERQYQRPLACTIKKKWIKQEPLAVACLFLTSNLLLPSAVYISVDRYCVHNDVHGTYGQGTMYRCLVHIAGVPRRVWSLGSFPTPVMCGCLAWRCGRCSPGVWCILQVCRRESEVSAVFPRQWCVDVWRDAVGDVHLRPGAMDGLQRLAGSRPHLLLAVSPFLFGFCLCLCVNAFSIFFESFLCMGWSQWA